jgi:hypothetical protein
MEHFRFFSASFGSISKSRLERRWRLGLRSTTPDIATAVSSSGWVAAATATEVRLYSLNDIDTTREIKKARSIEVKSNGETIRAIAVSHDLLAVVTHTHLRVYEYRESGNMENKLVETRTLDQNQTWTPRCLAIHQRGCVGSDSAVSAYVAVGGEGKNGVKLFNYSYKNCWTPHSDRIVLSCIQKTSAVRLVGFSPDRFNSADRFMVIGVTMSSQVYCWNLNARETEGPSLGPSWHLDCTLGRDDSVSPMLLKDDPEYGGTNDRQPHRGEISSAAIFLSPSNKPYVFCTVNQRPGSQIMKSFTAPIEASPTNDQSVHKRWQALPEESVGRNVSYGIVTPNGQFVVTIEDGLMKLLTLRGASEGGLTCHGTPLKWTSSLKPAAADVSALSLSVKEELGSLVVTAVDGLGNVEFVRVSVPDMPETEAPRIEPERPLEMSNHELRLELSTGENSHHSGTTASSGQAAPRIDNTPG